jgi:uncharacterized protein (TIGR02145 family)
MKLKNYTFLILLLISIANLKAQDYLISFAGSGASSTVTTVKVENLTQGTSLTMSGSNVLHLQGTITGIELILRNQNSQISFSPNPMTAYSIMQFDLLETGKTIIDLYDISGRKITETQDFLSKGRHTYRIQGVDKGIYIVTIRSDKYSVSGRLVCANSLKSEVKILYEYSTLITDSKKDIVLNEKENSSKGINTETIMQYTTGDRLKLTSITGIYTTVITDIPTSGKTITFSHVACTDGDNLNYPVVVIGSQTWMAENLKTPKYNDGTAIPSVAVSATWVSRTTGAYCDYGNTPANSTTYGKLYNWYAVDNNAATKVASNGGKNVCPVGWHVPSDAEWTTMENYLIANGNNYDGTTTGNKIAKSLAATTNWAANTIAGAPGNTDFSTYRNKTGFTALPGGYRLGDGSFYNIGAYGMWWSSTVALTNYAWYRNVYNNYNYVYRNYTLEVSGLSVRCLRD